LAEAKVLNTLGWGCKRNCFSPVPARRGSLFCSSRFLHFLKFLDEKNQKIYASLAFLDEMPTQISDIGIPTKSKMCSKPSLG